MGDYGPARYHGPASPFGGFSFGMSDKIIKHMR